MATLPLGRTRGCTGGSVAIASFPGPSPGIASAAAPAGDALGPTFIGPAIIGPGKGPVDVSIGGSAGSLPHASVPSNANPKSAAVRGNRRETSCDMSVSFRVSGAVARIDVVAECTGRARPELSYGKSEASTD
jgi:hypothetical protein